MNDVTSISPVIPNYITNYQNVRIATKSIPTMEEVTCYNACLQAVENYAKMMSIAYKATAQEMSK